MKRFLLFLILIAALLFLSSKYYFNTGLTINEYSIKSQELPYGFNGFKVVHFSDLLIDTKTNFDKIEYLVNSINDNNPDIIVFTGDVIKNAISSEKESDLIEILSKLKCKYNKYAILGDHDTLDSKEILIDSGFKLLDNEYDLIYQNDKAPIAIIGGNKLDESIVSKNNYAYSIALIHKPDYFDDIKDMEYNLILAGHSLGGQIRLPFVGALFKKDGANTYTNDYYKENNTIMYVSYGIGNEKYDLRFLNKPSYNIYRLYTK